MGLDLDIDLGFNLCDGVRIGALAVRLEVKGGGAVSASAIVPMRWRRSRRERGRKVCQYGMINDE